MTHNRTKTEATHDSRLLAEAKAQLVKLGFHFQEWSENEEEVDDFPFPQLGFSGRLGDIELGPWCYRVPQFNKEVGELTSRYTRNLDRLLTFSEARRGRPTKRCWAGEKTHIGKRLNPSSTPVGLGFYGAPVGVVALPYHAAEMAHVFYLSYDGAVENRGPNTYAAYIDGKQFGVREGRVLLPDGDTLEAGIPFDLDKFYGAFRYGSLASPLMQMFPMWAAIRRFSKSLDLSIDLFQSLCYLRHHFEWRARWASREGAPERRNHAAPTQSSKTPLREKLALVEMALERKAALTATPLDVARILCPAVITWAEFDDRFGVIQSNPNTNFHSKVHERFVTELRALYREIQTEIEAGGA